MFPSCLIQELLLSSNDLEDLLENSDPADRDSIRTALTVSRQNTFYSIDVTSSQSMLMDC